MMPYGIIGHERVKEPKSLIYWFKKIIVITQVILILNPHCNTGPGLGSSNKGKQLCHRPKHFTFLSHMSWNSPGYTYIFFCKSNDCSNLNDFKILSWKCIFEKICEWSTLLKNKQRNIIINNYPIHIIFLRFIAHHVFLICSKLGRNYLLLYWDIQGNVDFLFSPFFKPIF